MGQNINQQDIIENIDYISEKFSEISKQAEKLTFSRFKLNFFTSPDKELINREKFLFSMSHPLNTPFITHPLFFLVQFISFFVFILSFTFGFFSINSILESGVDFSNSISSSNWIMPSFSIIFGGYCSLITFHWWIDTIRFDKNWLKIIKSATFILIILSISTQFRIETQGLNTYEVILLIGLFLVSIVSFLSILIAYFYDSLQFVINFLITLLGGIFAINEPRPLKLVNKLVHEEIPTLSLLQNQQPNSNWKLLDLPKTDIQMLIRWSKENRESCTKRIIPTTVALAIFGILYSFQFFKDGFSSLSKNAILFFQTKNLTTIDSHTIIPMIVLVIMFYIISIFIISLFRLIQNIIAQNLVVEACLLAEYELENRAKIEKNNRKRNWFEKLLNYFGYYRKE